MYKGIYCLILQTPGCRLAVGKLGEKVFPPGWHIYVGSALGPGGLARVQRHIRRFREHGFSPKWHIDYLLLSPHFTLEEVVCAGTHEPRECDLARMLGGAATKGFGCSDCRCTSHLFYRSGDPRSEIGEAFKSLGLRYTRKTIK